MTIAAAPPGVERSIPRPALILGAGGAVPFVAFTFAVWLAPPAFAAWAQHALVTYAMIILTFVGALHWGFTMKTPAMTERERWTWMGWSVVPALAAWGAGMLPFRVAVALLVATFVVHLALDQLPRGAGVGREGEVRGEVAHRRLEGAGTWPFRREGPEVQARAQELVEQQVAAQDRRATLEEEQVRLHPEQAGGRGRETGVVRLQPAEGHHPPRSLLARFRHQVLELAGLVAAEGRPEQVVALHEDGPAQLGGEARQPLQGRRRVAQHHPRVRLQAGEQLLRRHGREGAASRRARRLARATIVSTVGRSSASGKTLASQT